MTRDPLFTAAGRPRASSPNNPFPPDVTALMAQQIALLQEQTALLRAQTSERQQEIRVFQSPQQILDAIDPSLRSELQKWRHGFRKDLGHWATHSELHHKYSKIIENGDIMKQFQEESNRKWQWPKHYEAIAKPVGDIDEELDADMQYDINAAWFSLRRKHALECQSFIAEHQKRAFAFFEERVSHQSAMRDVSDLWTEWKTHNASLLSSHVIAQAERSCTHFVDLVLREEVPKVRSRLQDAEATRAKREAAVIEAETKFEQMDPQQLIAMIELDKQAVVIKQADGTKIKEVVLCKSSELAALIRKYPDLEQYFRVKFVDSLPNKDKPAARRSPTPYPRKSSLTRSGRSTSKHSSCASSRSSSRKSTSKPTSRKRSTSSKRGPVHSSHEGKGKGKGRGKGKGGRKGKASDKGRGRGKQVRFNGSRI